MAYSATTERVSAEEFLAWEEKQPEKHELIDGEVYAMVSVTRQHATVAGNSFQRLCSIFKVHPAAFIWRI